MKKWLLLIDRNCAMPAGLKLPPDSPDHWSIAVTRKIPVDDLNRKIEEMIKSSPLWVNSFVLNNITPRQKETFIALGLAPGTIRAFHHLNASFLEVLVIARASLRSAFIVDCQSLLP